MNGFEAEVTSSRILPYKTQMWNSITYELSQTRHEYTRTVYSMLDFLGDIGGLFSALGPLCGVIVTAFQYRGSYMYLASTMLKNPERPDDLT